MRLAGFFFHERNELQINFSSQNFSVLVLVIYRSVNLILKLKLMLKAGAKIHKLAFNLYIYYLSFKFSFNFSKTPYNVILLHDCKRKTKIFSQSFSTLYGKNATKNTVEYLVN